MRCVLKINAQELSFICLVLSFCWRWLGLKLSTAKFHPGVFFLDFHVLAPKWDCCFQHAGWWKSQRGRRCDPSKGGCWCKTVAGWSIFCYWRPTVLPASSLLLQMHTRWLPPVCARFSLIPVMLAGLGCGRRQDFVDCSLFALAGFGAENMTAYPP